MNTVTGQKTPSAVQAFPSWMSYEEVLEELKVARSTMDRWRGDGRAPAFVKLPNLNYSSPGARQHVGSTKVPAW